MIVCILGVIFSEFANLSKETRKKRQAPLRDIGQEDVSGYTLNILVIFKKASCRGGPVIYWPAVDEKLGAQVAL